MAAYNCVSKTRVEEVMYQGDVMVGCGVAGVYGFSRVSTG
jgi:hypothetical protein